MKVTKQILKELGWRYDNKQKTYYYPDMPTLAWEAEEVIFSYTIKTIVEMMISENIKRCKEKVISAVYKATVD